MRVLPFLLATLTATLAFAGCLNDDGDSDPTPVDPAMPSMATHPVWVINGEGDELPLDAFQGALPRFVQQDVTERISGEPTVAITDTGAVFYAAIDFEVGVNGATTLPRTVYYRSLDHGKTWDDKSPNLLQVTHSHLYSFDPYVYSDPTTGRVYAVDMDVQAACNTVSWSDDDGRTWSVPRAGACPLPLTDHPTIFAGPATALTRTTGPLSYPNHLYLCTNEVAQTQCSHSPDGGYTWLPSAPVSLGVNEDFGPDSLNPFGKDFFNGVCSAYTGHGTVSWTDGTIYLPRLFCDVPVMYTSKDGGLTYQTTIVAEGGQYMGEPGVHDSMVAVDKNGTAYYLWMGELGTTAFLSISKDSGASWSEPMNVTVPGLTAMKLPGIVAGEGGRIALQYVGTTTPSGHQVDDREDCERGQNDPPCDLLHPSELRNATWNAYVGVSLDADGDDPVFAFTSVNALDEPLKRGGCSGRCFGDIGGMYDFLDIEIDPVTGQIYTALVDVCSGVCDEPGATADTWQRAFGAVGVQVGGARLLDGTEEDR